MDKFTEQLGKFSKEMPQAIPKVSLIIDGHEQMDLAFRIFESIAGNHAGALKMLDYLCMFTLVDKGKSIEQEVEDYCSTIEEEYTAALKKPYKLPRYLRPLLINIMSQAKPTYEKIKSTDRHD